MQGHFEAVVSVRDSVISGDLATAKKTAAALSERLRPETYPRKWYDDAAETHAATRAIAASDSLTDASREIARAATACGSCHRSNGIEASEAVVISAEVPVNRDEYMKQHLAAMENLWRGLVGPSDEAWSAGASALERAGAFPGDISRSEDFRARALHLERLGRWAAGAKDLQVRTSVYGQLLGSCSDCHDTFTAGVAFEAKPGL